MSIISLTLNRVFGSDIRNNIIRYIHGNGFMEQCEVCHLRRHIRYGTVSNEFKSGDLNGRIVCSRYCFNVIYARLDELHHLMYCSDILCPCKKYDKNGMRKKLLMRRYPLSVIQITESMNDASISCIRTLFTSDEFTDNLNLQYILNYYHDYIPDLNKNIINAFGVMWYYTFYSNDPRYRNLLDNAIQGEGIEGLMYTEEINGVRNGILTILDSTRYR